MSCKRTFFVPGSIFWKPSESSELYWSCPAPLQPWAEIGVKSIFTSMVKMVEGSMYRQARSINRLQISCTEKKLKIFPRFLPAQGRWSCQGSCSTDWRRRWDRWRASSGRRLNKAPQSLPLPRPRSLGYKRMFQSQPGNVASEDSGGLRCLGLVSLHQQPGETLTWKK